MKAFKRRSFLFYLLLSFLILLSIVIIPRLIVKSIEKGKVFTFNSESSYWPTSGWRVSTPEEQGIDSAALTKLFIAIKKPSYLRRIRNKIVKKLFGVSTSDHLSIDSVLIIRNGFIVAEAYSRNSGKDRLNPIYSSTKSFTSALFGIAMDKGYISSLDQPVLEFFPDQKPLHMDSRKRSITIRHLLTMSSGFEWRSAFEWSAWKTDYSNYGKLAIQMINSGNCIKFVLDKPMAQEPGTKFNYNSGCSQLLATIIHKQTGGDSLDFAKKTLFDPLGITDYEWDYADVPKDPDKKPVLNGSHGLNMRARDMAKFGYLFLKGGFWDGQQIISRKWIEESTKRHVDIPGVVGLLLDDYGYQWYIHSFGFHSLGATGQYIFVIPELEIVAVFSSSLRPHEALDPIRLVEKHLIPAVKSNRPLPHNPEAFAILKQAISRGIKSPIDF